MDMMDTAEAPSSSMRLDQLPVAPGVSVSAVAHTAADTADRAMLSWLPIRGSADSDLIPELGTIVPRSRDLHRNNGMAASGAQTLKDNIIGSVLRLSSKPDWRALGRNRDWAEDWSTDVEMRFRSWAETFECDAANGQNLLGLATLSMSSAMLNGDSLVIPMWLNRPGQRWRTRLMTVEADRLETPSWLVMNARIRGGVETDEYGAPVAYHIRKTHPGDNRFVLVRNDDYETVRAFDPITGRRRVIHLFDRERSGQSRGRPILTSVMREFRMLGQYGSTELQAAIANSLVAAVVESAMSQDAVAQMLGASTTEAESAWRQQWAEYRTPLKGGAIIPLPLGAKMTPFVPGRPNAAFESFVLAWQRMIAAGGFNVPYELLTKDFSRTNYSSARAALLEAWRYFQGRRAWFVANWLQPVYELWFEEAANRGEIEAPGFYDLRYAYLRARWIFAGRGWVDPYKEAQAAEKRMSIGVSTLESECAEQGLDWEEVLEQRARENARMAELGLPLPGSEQSAAAQAIEATDQEEKQ